MAKSTRDKLKRKLAQAYRNIDNTLMDLKVVYDMFKNVHSDLAEGLATSITLLIHSQDVILLFAEKCWEIDKDTLLSYL